jgi:hypothetical protein
VGEIHPAETAGEPIHRVVVFAAHALLGKNIASVFDALALFVIVKELAHVCFQASSGQVVHLIHSADLKAAPPNSKAGSAISTQRVIHRMTHQHPDCRG